MSASAVRSTTLARTPKLGSRMMISVAAVLGLALCTGAKGPKYWACKGPVCIQDLKLLYYPGSVAESVRGTFWNKANVPMRDVTLTFSLYCDSSVCGDAETSVAVVPSGESWDFRAPVLVTQDRQFVTAAKPIGIQLTADKFYRDTLDLPSVCRPQNWLSKHACPN